MSTFESEVVKASCSDEDIFRFISDLRNLEFAKHKVPADKISDLSFDKDSCHFNISMLGKVGLKVVDRDPYKTVKYGSDNSPVGFDLWIQLKKISENDTRIKVTMKAEMNFMIKQLIEPMVEPMLGKLARALASFPYEKYQK
jgi:hypothetical protein